MFERFKVAMIKRYARKNLGRDIAPLMTTATHPGVVIPYARFNMALNKTNLVPGKLKVLGQVKAAKMVECPF